MVPGNYGGNKKYIPAVCEINRPLMFVSTYYLLIASLSVVRRIVDYMSWCVLRRCEYKHGWLSWRAMHRNCLDTRYEVKIGSTHSRTLIQYLNVVVASES